MKILEYYLTAKDQLQETGQWPVRPGRNNRYVKLTFFSC